MKSTGCHILSASGSQQVLHSGKPAPLTGPLTSFWTVPAVAFYGTRENVEKVVADLLHLFILLEESNLTIFARNSWIGDRVTTKKRDTFVTESTQYGRVFQYSNLQIQPLSRSFFQVGSFLFEKVPGNTSNPTTILRTITIKDGNEWWFCPELLDALVPVNEGKEVIHAVLYPLSSGVPSLQQVLQEHTLKEFTFLLPKEVELKQTGPVEMVEVFPFYRSSKISHLIASVSTLVRVYNMSCLIDRTGPEHRPTIVNLQKDAFTRELNHLLHAMSHMDNGIVSEMAGCCNLHEELFNACPPPPGYMAITSNPILLRSDSRSFLYRIYHVSVEPAGDPRRICWSDHSSYVKEAYPRHCTGGHWVYVSITENGYSATKVSSEFVFDLLYSSAISLMNCPEVREDASSTNTMEPAKLERGGCPLSYVQPGVGAWCRNETRNRWALRFWLDRSILKGTGKYDITINHRIRQVIGYMVLAWLDEKNPLPDSYLEKDDDIRFKLQRLEVSLSLDIWAQRGVHASSGRESFGISKPITMEELREHCGFDPVEFRKSLYGGINKTILAVALLDMFETYQEVERVLRKYYGFWNETVRDKIVETCRAHQYVNTGICT